MAKWISVTLAALALSSVIACGPSVDDMRDAFLDDLREQGTSATLALEMADVYEQQIEAERPEEYSRAYSIARVGLGFGHGRASSYASAYVKQLDAGKTEEYSGAFAEQKTKGRSENYSHLYARSYSERITAGDSKEQAGTYAELRVIGKSSEYARAYNERIAADSPVKNAVYEAEIADGKSHDDARMYATYYVEADSDSLFYSHAYAKARFDGESRFYANPYACAYEDKVGTSSGDYVVAFAEKYAERVYYRHGAEYLMSGCLGYKESDRDYRTVERKAKYFATVYAGLIELGYSQIYADAYARQTGSGQSRDFAGAYAEQIDDGQSDGYAYTYATQIGEGNSVEYAHSYSEQIEAGQSIDYARSYAEQVTAGRSAVQAAKAAVAGDLIAETDRLIRTFPGEDKCYVNASAAASELLEEGKTPHYAAMFSWARECDLQTDEQAHDIASEYE